MSGTCSIEEKEDAYIIIRGIPERRRPLGRHRRRWEANIKRIFKNLDGRVWIHLPQDQWRNVVNTVMNLSAWRLSTEPATVSFIRFPICGVGVSAPIVVGSLSASAPSLRRTTVARRGAALWETYDLKSKRRSFKGGHCIYLRCLLSSLFSSFIHLFATEQVSVAVKFEICIREMLCSNLRSDTGYPG